MQSGDVFAGAFDARSDSAAVLDADGALVAVNDTWRERTRDAGVPLSEVGADYPGACAAAGFLDAADALRSLLDGDSDCASVEYAVDGAAGTWYAMEADRFTVDGADYVLVVHADVTARKTCERVLREFSSALTHDVRNALTVAAGFLDLEDPDAEATNLDRVRDALETIDDVVSDAREFAAVPTAVTDPEPVVVADAARDAWANVDTGRLELAVETEVEVAASRPHLVRALERLVENSREHGARVVTVGDTDTGFYVADDGTGIPRENREGVLEPGLSTTEHTGFGLTVVRRIADAHGWTVSLADSENGTCFEFDCR